MSLNKSFYFAALLTLLVGTTTTPTHLSDESVIASYQGKDGAWQYLEYLFVVQPNNKIKQLTHHTSAALGGAGAATLVAAQTNNLPTYKLDDDMVKKVIVALSAFAAGTTVYNYFLCCAKRKVHKQTLVNILKNWQTHRKHIPVAFTQCLDELFLMYQEQGSKVLTDNLVTQVFELIQHHIEHNFASRYKPAEIKVEPTISNVKSMTDIMKNLG